MTTNSQYTSLLRKKWIDYLSASVDLRDERNVKLDSFLNKILYLQEKYKFEKCPEFSDLTSCGNILTSQFLTDVHQVCTECSGEIEDVTPLIHYLLEGRGWKILWLIKFVGVQSLHSNQDLAKLLLSLFPLYSQFNLYSLSQNSSANSFSDKQIYDNIESCFQTYIKSKTQLTCSKKSLRRKNFHRQRKRNLLDSPRESFKIHARTADSSDSDFPSKINHGKKEPLVHIRLNPMDFIYFSKANVKSSDELDSDDAISLDEKDLIQDLGQRSINFLQFCECVIGLLQKICLEDDAIRNKLNLSPPVSAEVLPFALKMFESVHQDGGYVGNWSPREAYRIKQQLLYLIFTSASALVCIPDGLLILDQCCVIQNLLAVVGNTQLSWGTSDDDNTDSFITKEESILLGFNVICGCLMLMSIVNEQCLAKHDFEGLMKGIYFSPIQRQIIANGLAMYESCYEDNAKVSSRITQLINMITQSIALMKSKRVVHWHMKECNKVRHKRCNFMIYNHHHHDSFGVWKNQCSANEDQTCCIANFVTVLLETYQTSINANTHSLILSSLKRVGLCCCLQVDVVITSLLNCLQNQSPFLRQMVFNFVETTVLEQLTGSTNFSAALQFCTVCKYTHEKTTKLMTVVQESVNSSEPVTVLELNTILSGNVTVWGAVKLYCDALVTNDLNLLVHQIEKHILQLCLSGNHLVGCEIFLRVVIPIFLNAQISSEENNNHFITWCLTAFSILLKHTPLAEIFLKLSGLELLKNYLKIANFRTLVLRILHVLIIPEVDKLNDDVPFEDLISLKGFEAILIDLCADFTNKCTLTQEDKCVSEKANLISMSQAELEYQCDIWSTCMSLISKSQLCKMYFKNGCMAEISYKMLVNLVHLMSQDFSSVVSISDVLQARRFLKSALNLLEVLLAFCLSLCPFAVEGNEVICQRVVCEVLRKSIFSITIWHPDDSRLLLESVINAVQETPAKMKRKTEQLYLEAFLPTCEETDFQDLELDSSLQTTFDKSFSQLDEGYEADVELPDQIKDHTVTCPQNENQVLYMDIMELTLEYLKKMVNKQNVNVDFDNPGIRALTLVIRRLVRLCRENCNNCFGLYNLDVLNMIFQDFRKFIIVKHASLRELQYNLLDLFVVIGQYSITCETFSLFFTLFKEPEPPLDLLLKALNELILNTAFQPECCLCFPSNTQKVCYVETFIPRADSLLTVDDYFSTSSYECKIQNGSIEGTNANEPKIDSFRAITNEHFKQDVLSPWSRATCFLPVADLTEISFSSKFSFSLWMKTSAPSTQFFSRELHLRQTGFEKSKRRDDGKNSSLGASEILSNGRSNLNEDLKSNITSKHALHIASIGHESMLFEVWSLPAFESLVVRVSVNENSQYSILSESLCKSILKLDQWHYVSINYYTELQEEEMVPKVKIIVDGYISENVILDVKSAGSKQMNSFNVLLIGHDQLLQDISLISWHLCSFAIFKDVVLDLEVNLVIYALGPNNTNLLSSITETDKVNLPVDPIRKLLKTGLSPDLLEKTFNAQLANIKDDILLLYVPQSPQHFVNYNNSRKVSPKKRNDHAFEIVPIHIEHDLRVLKKRTVESVITQLGGVSAMLLLLCRIIEQCSQEEIQAQAVTIVLQFIGNSSKQKTDFLELNGPSLLTKVFSTHRFCAKYLTLKAITDSSLSSPVLLGVNAGRQPLFSQNTNAVILNAEVLLSSLTLWKTWERYDVNVLHTFLVVIKELINENHPDYHFNRLQLSPDFINIVLTSFKERFIEDRLAMPKETCHLFMSLMGMMLAYPPEINLLRPIFDFLLLAHPAANTRLTDDGYNFYFSLRSSARFGPITIAVSSGLKETEDSSSVVSDKPVSAKKNNDSTENTMWDLLESLVNSESDENNDTREASEYNTAEADSTNSLTSHEERITSKRKETLSNIVQVMATSETENLRLLYMNSPGKSNSSSHCCSSISETRTFYQDYEIIQDVPFNMTSSEITSGSEDSSFSTEWEVLTVLEPEETCNHTCIEQNYLVILCSGLLNMVIKILEHLPDQMRDAIPSSVIKPQELLVLANNSNDLVRTAVVKLLNSYLQHATDEQKFAFLKIKGFIMLANQLRRHTATLSLVEASLSLILDRHFTFDNFNVHNVKLSTPVQHESICLILAIMPTLTSDIALCHNLLNFLLQVFKFHPDTIDSFISNALLEVLIQVIASIVNSNPRPTVLNNSEEQDLLFDDIKKLLNQISFISISGHFIMHVFLDNLLLLLSYLEKRENKLNGVDRTRAHKIRHLKYSCLQTAIDHLFQFSLDTDRPRISKYLTALRIIFPLESVATAGKKFQRQYPDVTIKHLLKLITRAVDYLVYSDDSDKIPLLSNYEKCFIRYLTQLLIQAENTIIECRTHTLLWNIRDGIRLELLRLMIYSLSTYQSLEQRLFAVNVLMKEQQPTLILSNVLSVKRRLRNMFYVLLQHLIKIEIVRMLDQEKKLCHQLLEIVKSLDVTFPDTKAYFSQERENRIYWLVCRQCEERKLLMYRNSFVQTVCENAKTVTRNIMISQNKVRKEFLATIKASHGQQILIRSMWEQIITQLTHERAIWNFPECYPQSWQLDFSEGPHRERRRLQRTHLHLDKRHLLPEHQLKLESASQSQPFRFLSEDEDLSFGCPTFLDCLHANETIKYNLPCTIITPAREVSGDILVGNVCLYFVGEELKSNSLSIQMDDLVLIKWMFDDVKEVFKRRYELQESAVEIFLVNGQTFLLVFKSEKDRDSFYQFVLESSLPNLDKTEELSALTERWQDGTLTNFDYLMHLNKLAGRSFSDLMQYPIFPFILSNYTGTNLNLLDPQNFRNLSRPMAVQDKKREQHYINNYQYLKVEKRKGSVLSGEMMPAMDPYHYGSHYSNSITVLYFLVRLPPFTGIFLKYQDGNFDIPDRSFHSINTTWRLSSAESNTDMKELIPEMFFLPELLTNFEGFDFGIRQSGERVEDVILPPWCRNDPRLFTLIHRQALESNYVTEHLCEWIDLIFGYKQTGKAAVEALNVFHPTTYYGFELDSVKDPIQQDALKTMIRTLGQTPQKLFHMPHPMVTLHLVTDKKNNNSKRSPLAEVQGLKWGDYVGSPACERPNLLRRSQENPPVVSFVSLKTNDIFGLAANCCLILSYSKNNVNSNNTTYVTTSALVTWRHVDGNVRIKWRRDQKTSILLKGTINDPVVSCATVPESPILFVGHQSGIIVAYTMDFDSENNVINMVKRPVHLYGHTESIIAICICLPFGIMATASSDGVCIIWDITSLSFIRSIKITNVLRLISISSTSGDIAVVNESGSGSLLQLFGINCNFIAEISTKTLMNSVCFSCALEGVSVNVIATGMENGQIKLWSTWDLTLVSTIQIEKFTEPIISLTYTSDAQLLYATNTKGELAVWENGNKTTGKMLKYQSLS